MRKKNLKVQVAALAVTGVIAATPLSVRAGETGNPAATNTEAALSTATAAASATSQEQLQRQQAQEQQIRLRVPEPPLRQAELQAVQERQFRHLVQRLRHRQLYPQM